MQLDDPASSIARALGRRQVARAVGGREVAIRNLLLNPLGESSHPLGRFSTALLAAQTSPTESAESLRGAVESAGLGAAFRPAMSSALEEAVTPERRRPVLMRAALAVGALAAGSPGSREALAAATLCAERILMSGGLTHSPWAAPTQLDAATRSSAVQLERTGDWAEWARAWCMLVTREGAATERALRQTRERMSREAEAARSQHRIGATDAVVLAMLHSESVFTIPAAIAPLGLSAPTIGTSIERLAVMGFALELTGQSRDRVWTSTALLDLSLTP